MAGGPPRTFFEALDAWVREKNDGFVTAVDVKVAGHIVKHLRPSGLGYEDVIAWLKAKWSGTRNPKIDGKLIEHACNRPGCSRVGPLGSKCSCGQYFLE